MPEALYPDWLLALVRDMAPHLSGQYAAQLLWQRGLRTQEAVKGFLQMAQYQPTGPEAFGGEIVAAIDRLEQARQGGESVTIWGDFDADGVTATAVLLEGLGQFLPKAALNYLIPNRLTDSHGLNAQGLHNLHQQGTDLIITCDTGSTGIAEINLANQLGMDVIVTDHHALPPLRPPAVAIINPRTLPDNHPLATLSGVAIAYKVVEAWYQRCPEIPQRPLEDLLDLVAMGLIADLVELKQDCRYLAQRGLQTLKTRLHDQNSRPGVAALLRFCQKAGDRPTDISFGIGPRINAVSRVHGDASFCVELLTSLDLQRCTELAIETELANSRRKALQHRIKQEAIAEIKALDLLATQVIIIARPQWPVGILGLVAGDIAQTYKRPAILLQLETNEAGVTFAKGSARSALDINLYDLIAEQSHLLTKFGGHPFAAGLSLPAANIELLRQALNHAMRSRPPLTHKAPSFDLVVSVKELGQSLFKELQLLEPYGMGNPPPRLLIKDCWFEQLTHRHLRDRTGKKLRYIQAKFSLCDQSCPQGFPGVWWERYKDDIPVGRCHVIAELEFNNYQRRTEIRILEEITSDSLQAQDLPKDEIKIFDYRNRVLAKLPEDALIISQSPQSWDEWRQWVQRSRRNQRPLVLAYGTEPALDAVTTWQHLVGVAKTAIRLEKPVLQSDLMAALQLSNALLANGLSLLDQFGVVVSRDNGGQLIFSGQFSRSNAPVAQIQTFIEAIDEARFQQRYLSQIPAALLQSAVPEQSPAKFELF